MGTNKDYFITLNINTTHETIYYRFWIILESPHLGNWRHVITHIDSVDNCDRNDSNSSMVGEVVEEVPANKDTKTNRRGHNQEYGDR